MNSTTIYGALPTASSGPYHYLYRITNLVEQKHYYGIRTSRNTLPQQDLGVKYFSSSNDKEFKKDQKVHPENYRYKIIIISDSRERVADLEIKLHIKFNVGVNPKFYNRAIHTSTGFDVSGKVSVRDDFGNTSQVSVNDPRISSGELQPVNKGMVAMKDKNGTFFQVSVNDQRIATGELQYVSTGMVPVKDKNGITSKVFINDPRISSGELQYISTGMVPMKDKNGTVSMVSVNDPRIPTGELQSVHKGLRWIHNPETNQNRRIKPEENLPSGWFYGTTNEFGKKLMPSSSKGLKFIYNLELKQNKMIKPTDPLPLGWKYGQKNFNCEGFVPPLTGRKRIFNPELKKEMMIDPNTELPLGWFYGRLNSKMVISVPKGSKMIHNIELKQNKFIKPDEILPEGWEYGQKRTWD